MSSTLRSVSTTAAYCGLVALAAFLILLYATNSPVTYGQTSSQSSASSGMSTSMSMSSMSSMSSSWSTSSMSGYSASSMSQMSARSDASFQSGWPGAFPEIVGYTRTFFQPQITSMPRGFPYWQRVTYRWTGGADKILDVTIGRGPSLRRMALMDLRKRPGLTRVRVGNYRGWLWVNRNPQGNMALNGKLVLVLGGNKHFMMEARGQGPWESLTDLVKRFDLPYTARALASPPQISRQ